MKVSDKCTLSFYAARVAYGVDLETLSACATLAFGVP